MVQANISLFQPWSHAALTPCPVPYSREFVNYTFLNASEKESFMNQGIVVTSVCTGVAASAFVFNLNHL